MGLDIPGLDVLTDLMGGGKENDVNYNPVELDQGAKDLIGGIHENAMKKSAGDYAKGLMSGTQAAQIQAAPGSGAMDQALQNKAQGMANQDYSNLSRTADLEGKRMQGQQMNRSHMNLVAMQKINSENQHRVQQAYMANEKARGAVLGQILGVGGMIAGAMIAGPAGAAVGQNILAGTSSQSVAGGADDPSKFGNMS